MVTYLKKIWWTGLLASASLALYAAPQLRLTQTTLPVVSVTQGSNASAQTVDIANSGDGTLNPTVTGSAAWLVPTVGASHACSDGSAPSCLPILIALPTAALASGIYVGLITVYDKNAVDAPQTITLSVQVGTGVPAKFDFTLPIGGAASTHFNTTVSSLVSSATADPKATWLTAAQDGGSPFSPSIPYKVAVNTTAGSLATGDYTGSVTVTGSTNAVDNKTVPVTLHVVAQPIAGPLITVGAALNNATYAAGESLAQGDIVALFGAQFTTGAAAGVTSLPLPTTLGGIQLSLNGTPVPLYYTAAGQINFQVPYNAPIGAATLQVANNGTTGNTISVTIAKAVPRLLRLNGNYADYGIITNPDTTLPIPTSLGGVPAKVGAAIIIYALGFGPTSPSVDAGVEPPSAEPLARVVNPTVCFAAPTPFTTGICTAPFYAGLAPHFPRSLPDQCHHPSGFPNRRPGSGLCVHRRRRQQHRLHLRPTVIS